MAETTDYYALLSPVDLKTPVGVFRVRRSDGGLFIESWAGGGWVDGPYSLGRFVYDGEPGSEAITAAEADRIRMQQPAGNGGWLRGAWRTAGAYPRRP